MPMRYGNQKAWFGSSTTILIVPPASETTGSRSGGAGGCRTCTRGSPPKKNPGGATGWPRAITGGGRKKEGGKTGIMPGPGPNPGGTGGKGTSCARAFPCALMWPASARAEGHTSAQYSQTKRPRGCSGCRPAMLHLPSWLAGVRSIDLGTRGVCVTSDGSEKMVCFAARRERGALPFIEKGQRQGRRWSRHAHAKCPSRHLLL